MYGFKKLKIDFFMGIYVKYYIVFFTAFTAITSVFFLFGYLTNRIFKKELRHHNSTRLILILMNVFIIIYFLVLQSSDYAILPESMFYIVLVLIFLYLLYSTIKIIKNNLWHVYEISAISVNLLQYVIIFIVK